MIVGGMIVEKKVTFDNDYYVLGKDFRLISFNKAVADRYPGIKVGDYCYKATMNRESPCMHCPIAGYSDSDSPIYFDPFYNDWLEAVFCELGDGKYSVTRRLASATHLSLFSDKENSFYPSDESGRAVNDEIISQFHEQLQIISGLNSIFFSICLIDLREKTFRLLSISDSFKDTIATEGSAEYVMQRMADDFVSPEYQQTMREFNDIGTMSRRLIDKKILTIDYIGVTVGWSRAVVIPIERTDGGEATKILYCLRSITGQKERELKQQAALEEQMMIIKGLATEYFSVMIIDYVRNSVRIFRETGTEGKEIGEFFRGFDTWSEGIRAYSDKFVAEDEREGFYRLLSLENLRSNLKDFSANYTQVTQRGEAHLQFKVAYGTDKNGCGFAVVGSKNVDAEFQNQETLRNVQQEITRSYSIIEGLSQEYHTVCYVTTADRKMHLFRSTGDSTLSAAVKLALDYPDYSVFLEKYIDKFVDENDWENVREAAGFDTLLSKVHEKSVYTVNYLRHDEDGSESYHQMAFARALDGNGAVNLVLAFRNIDSLVKEEQEKQRVLRDALAAAEHANHAKTTFLNNMSHDIRTPMNAIIGFTSLAAAHIDNMEQVRDYLEKIQISSKHLLSLINDVLDMSRIESGKVKIEEKDTHLPEVMHDLRTIVQADITSKQLVFYIDTVDVINEDVVCDKLRLNQVLMNILSNAMKFTKPGGIVSLRLVQKPCAQAGYAQYEFHIRDTGIGMSKDFISHVFEPFERESTSTVSGIQGTGLGMAITKNIVDMMGGTITVESELGKGSEFTVCLQLKISGQPVKFSVVPELQGLRVLVADDDANTCMSICKMLSTVGMRSEWTSYGKEAVIRTQFAIEQDDEFNAFIIDWLMPDMNGIEVVRRIRRFIGESKPIIILTAYDWADIEEEAREAGVTAFCSKPLFMSELRDILIQPFKADESEDAEDNAAVDFKGRKILLVEDNELNQEIAVEILKEAGFELDVAGDGNVAVDKVANAEPGQYDLILMDIQMPVMDGYEATRQIRKLPNKLAAEIPIIAMTANAFEEDKENAYEAGMNGHISKPIETDKLLETLAEILRDKPKKHGGFSKKHRSRRLGRQKK